MAIGGVTSAIAAGGSWKSAMARVRLLSVSWRSASMVHLLRVVSFSIGV